MKTALQRYGINYGAQAAFADDTGPWVWAAHAQKEIDMLAWQVRNYKALLEYIATPRAVLDDAMRNHIRGVLNFEPAENLGAAANVLIARAEAEGMVVRIETRPRLPLAMGNYDMVASVQARMEPR